MNGAHFTGALQSRIGVRAANAGRCLRDEIGRCHSTARSSAASRGGSRTGARRGANVRVDVRMIAARKRTRRRAVRAVASGERSIDWKRRSVRLPPLPGESRGHSEGVHVRSFLAALPGSSGNVHECHRRAWRRLKRTRAGKIRELQPRGRAGLRARAGAGGQTLEPSVGDRGATSGS